MASTVASLSIPATTTFAVAAAGDVLPRRKAGGITASRVWFPMAAAARRGGGGFAVRSTGPATPSDISDKLSESIKEAEATCADEKGTAECAAAWDNVEEISAAASHARDNLKENSDPLEKYCKENPETDECRIYDN